jgi:hypothetical protein
MRASIIALRFEPPGHLVCISGLRTGHQNRANRPLPNNDGALAFVGSFRDQFQIE